MLTQSRLKELLDYDPETGHFTWLVSRGPIRVGQLAGHMHDSITKLYWRICVDYERYYAHHLAWLFVHGFIPAEIDHADGNGLNNSSDNLRCATRSQNNVNKETPNGELRGAYYDERVHRWYAKIQVNGIPIWLGHFETAEGAHGAYQCAAVKYFGEFVPPPKDSQPNMEP